MINVKGVVDVLEAISKLKNDIVKIYSRCAAEKRIDGWRDTMTIDGRTMSFSCYPLPNCITLIAWHIPEPSNAAGLVFDSQALLTALSKKNIRSSDVAVSLDNDCFVVLKHGNGMEKISAGPGLTQYRNSTAMDAVFSFSAKIIRKLHRNLIKYATSSSMVLDINVSGDQVEFCVLKKETKFALVHGAQSTDDAEEHPNVLARFSVPSSIAWMGAALPPRRVMAAMICAVLNALGTYASTLSEDARVELAFPSTVQYFPCMLSVQEFRVYVSPVES
jgi:hypothetical protein